MKFIIYTIIFTSFTFVSASVTYEGYSASLAKQTFGHTGKLSSWNTLLEPFSLIIKKNQVVSISSWPTVWKTEGEWKSKDSYLVTGKAAPWFWHASQIVLNALPESENYRYLTLARWTPPIKDQSDQDIISTLYVNGYVYLAESERIVKAIPLELEFYPDSIHYHGQFMGLSILNGKKAEVQGLLSADFSLVDYSTHFTLYFPDREPIHLTVAMRDDCSLMSYGTAPHHLRANFFGPLLEELGGTFTTTFPNQAKVTGIFALTQL